MKAKLLITLIAIGLFTSCNPKSELRVNLKTSTLVNDNPNHKDSIYVVNSEYFEIGLYSYTDLQNVTYSAKKEIEQSNISEVFKMVTLSVVDASNKDVVYNNSTEFLNYMSERGYEMTDQEKFKYRTDYTFKKK